MVIETNIEISTEMIAFTVIEVGLEKKHCLYNARKDNGFVSNNPRIEQFHKVLQQVGPDKLVAIRFILASSENFDDMDCLIAEGIVYVKHQEVENLADENSSSQNDVNHVNHEPVDSVKDEEDLSYRDLVEKEKCLTQDSQEHFDFIDGVEIELIEGKVDNYSMEYAITYAHGEIDYQSIDKSETTELQDVPIQVAIEQEIEECTEEVVSDMTLPVVYRVDTEIHTVVKLKCP